MKKIIFISSIVLIFDQLTKYFISKQLLLNDSISVINNFFSITHVHNNGAAWSILSGNRLFLVIMGIISLVLIYLFLIKGSKLNKIDNICYGLLIGGIIGNLIDRVIHGYVIDYFDFIIFSYDFPIFNIADICIVISVILICINLIIGDNNERI